VVAVSFYSESMERDFLLLCLCAVIVSTLKVV
jgi:hypothetical protein